METSLKNIPGALESMKESGAFGGLPESDDVEENKHGGKVGNRVASSITTPIKRL